MAIGTFPTRQVRWRTLTAFSMLTVLGLAWMARHQSAHAAGTAPKPDEQSFQQVVSPFLKQNCVRCHNADLQISGVRVDVLDNTLEDRRLKLWEAVRHRISDGSMPPKGQPQPSSDDRQKMLAWINQAIDYARSRPVPKNGSVRRLTVAQYRNTLRELLQLEDDLAEVLPPDAVSKDGFQNNAETLQLSPLLMEAYLELADEALQRTLVDPAQKPQIQNFRMDLGAGINKDPLPGELVLGANSWLLENKDFTVTQLTAKKPFPFEPFFMTTKYRFIEGYAGNDTVRGWRDFDSIYHSVFACMRGSRGYPKGNPNDLVPGGLLLRPAIPTDELFGGDGTYGPRANFKIALRELPDNGRFRVTVTAAKYNDGLLLEKNVPPQSAALAGAVESRLGATTSVAIPKAGIYQVDVHAAPLGPASTVSDASKLSEGLVGTWPPNEEKPAEGRLNGNARMVDSPFGKAVMLDGNGDSFAVPRSTEMNVGEGEFTVSAWIKPKQLRRAGIVAMGGHNWTHGWYLEMPDNKGTLRFETSRADNQSNGAVTSPPGVLRKDAWQQVTAIVRRGTNQTKLYVNGYLVAKGDIGSANLDNPRMDLHIGRIPGAQQFHGEIDEVRLYRRALGETEMQALVDPGKSFVKPPPEQPQDLTLTLGDRVFSGALEKPAFVVVRLPAGPLGVKAEHVGLRGLERVVFTPLPDDGPLARRFTAFEKRVPRLGVHLGFRRDCGHTFAPVGAPQTVTGEVKRYVFEGAIRNYPNPEVEKDNVNYLAGIREIAVRSEYTDGRDMPRLLIQSIEFEGPYFETWPPAPHRSVFIDLPGKKEGPTYARAILRNFATRAYRRPVTPEEEATLLDVYTKSAASGRTFRDSVKDALQVALTSPQFLFLVETSKSPEPEPLTSYELASKLSYFLWNGPPDAALLKAANAGTLRSRLETEVDRMVADSRFSQFTREFVSQWLSLEKFQVLEPDRNRFPKLTRETRAELLREPVHFVQHLIRNNLPVRNLVESDLMVANEVVASYYDLGEKTESGFQFVPVVHGRKELGGVLTQAAILAGLSDGRESNPVKRGAWMARRIVSEPPDDPPPNVPALKENTAKTLRERLEQHRSQPGCMQCHMKVDPWGVALEEFDAGGRLKTEPADARAKLPDGTEVAGLQDLRKYLGQDRVDQLAFSVLKHLTTYATGRTLSYNELNFLKQDGQRLRSNGYRMKDMVRYVASSKMFLEK